MKKTLFENAKAFEQLRTGSGLTTNQSVELKAEIDRCVKDYDDHKWEDDHGIDFLIKAYLVDGMTEEDIDRENRRLTIRQSIKDMKKLDSNKVEASQFLSQLAFGDRNVSQYDAYLITKNLFNGGELQDGIKPPENYEVAKTLIDNFMDAERTDFDENAVALVKQVFEIEKDLGVGEDADKRAFFLLSTAKANYNRVGVAAKEKERLRYLAKEARQAEKAAADKVGRITAKAKKLTEEERQAKRDEKEAKKAADEKTRIDNLVSKLNAHLAAIKSNIADIERRLKEIEEIKVQLPAELVDDYDLKVADAIMAFKAAADALK
ncbi:hypothetical protein AGMMS50268_19490 [Spirochaetia bacterium]|nr:hypothetical protein AGMMS50268_19490 [Spirochaetia bacterium]